MSTIFPKWTNHIPTAGAVIGVVKVTILVGLVWYYFTPKFWEVGYMPAQPLMSVEYRNKAIEAERTKPGSGMKAGVVAGEDYPGFSHLIHAGKLGMDCRYCHNHVEKSPEANIPPVSTCYGCHAPDHVSTNFAPDDRVWFIRQAYQADESITWRRVHKLPDYVRNFPHNVHVNAGVSCYSCHGMIARMPVVHQTQSLSMGWCLDCHRNPEPSLVPKDKVTDLFWVEAQLKNGNRSSAASVTSAGSPGGAALKTALEQNALHILPQNCGACHY